MYKYHTPTEVPATICHFIERQKKRNRTGSGLDGYMNRTQYMRPHSVQGRRLAKSCHSKGWPRAVARMDDGYSSLLETFRFPIKHTVVITSTDPNLARIHMAITEMFPERQMRLQGHAIDVYQYDVLPKPLRIQITQVIRDTLGCHQSYFSSGYRCQPTYDYLSRTTARELGVDHLTNDEWSDSQFINFIRSDVRVDWVLGAIELACKAIDIASREHNYMFRQNASALADSALEEINHRFKQHGIGYEFSGQVVRIDSQIIHAEAVKPALLLLNRKGFEGAEDEFLRAHEHHRAGKHKESMNECLKSIESTIKVIAKRRKWSVKEPLNAQNLIDACFAHKFIPDFWQSSLTSLRSLLISSVPTGRNKLTGHGQGETPVAIPAEIAQYMLHMTASTILFLCEVDASTPL